jgi:hypothetical protein
MIVRPDPRWVGKESASLLVEAWETFSLSKLWVLVPGICFFFHLGEFSGLREAEPGSTREVKRDITDIDNS